VATGSQSYVSCNFRFVLEVNVEMYLKNNCRDLTFICCENNCEN